MLQRTGYHWPSRMRSVAFAIWAVAFALTGALGWAAWNSYQTASETADYVAWRQEAGLAVPVLKTIIKDSETVR